MSETRQIAVTLEMVDAVSPVLRAIETLIETGLPGEPAMPHNPVDVLVMPGSTKALLVPSEQLVSFLWSVAHDARQAAYAAIAEAQTAQDGLARTISN